MNSVVIDGSSLTLTDLVAVARSGHQVSLSDAARDAMARSRAWVERAANGELVDEDGSTLPVYGVNTGFGSLARQRIAPEHIQELSWNLLRSHAAGVGPAVAHDQVRGMMLLRANALAKGASGCRPALVDTLLAMLDRGVVPEVPSQGSCGSSGDLAPLSHLALVACRGAVEDPEESGWAWFQGERMRGADAMRRAGIERLVPGPKEGLAMNNGAQLSTSIGALAAFDAHNLVLAAEIACAMSFEALLGVTRALHPAVHALRPYAGARACAANLRALVDGSSLVDSVPEKVQDAYTLRCTPQVLGGVRDGIAYATQQLGIELNAATDNPLLLLDEPDLNKAFSAGMFHGEPVGLACDHLKLCVSELASLSERRTFRLTTGTLSARLPAGLHVQDRPGTGLLIPHTTAASLVSENKALGWPASADSLPTCEDQEDHVAMSTTAARRAAEVVANSQRVVAVELLVATHALRWRQQQGEVVLGHGSRIALDLIGPILDEQPAASEAIEAIRDLIDGALPHAVGASVDLLGVGEVP